METKVKQSRFSKKKMVIRKKKKKAHFSHLFKHLQLFLEEDTTNSGKFNPYGI